MIELVKFKNGRYGIRNKNSNRYLSFASCVYWFNLKGSQDLCQTSYEKAKYEYDKLTSDDYGEVIESSDENIVSDNVSSETNLKSKKLTTNLISNNASRFFSFFSIFK